MTTSTALLIVDVQVDFCEGGKLAVRGGANVAGRISEYLLSDPPYRAILASQDYHVNPGRHFSDNPDFKDSWPPHCQAGHPGSLLHPGLDTSAIQHVFYKGINAAAYSAFEGFCDPLGVDIPNPDNDLTGARFVGLQKYLADRNITALDVCGIATDYCVRATALDAVKFGFETKVLLGMCCGVDPSTSDEAVRLMELGGIRIVRNGATVLS